MGNEILTFEEVKSILKIEVDKSVLHIQHIETGTGTTQSQVLQSLQHIIKEETQFNKTLEGWGAKIEGIFSGADGGAFDMGRIADEVNKPEGGLISAFKLLSTQIRMGFLDAFTLKSEDGTTLVGESSTWGDVIKSIINTYVKPPMEEFIDWMAK